MGKTNLVRRRSGFALSSPRSSCHRTERRRDRLCRDLGGKRILDILKDSRIGTYRRGTAEQVGEVSVLLVLLFVIRLD
jgi:hypothetical protein